MKYRNRKSEILLVLITISLSIILLSSCETHKAVNPKIDIQVEENDSRFNLTTKNAILRIEKDYLTNAEMIDITEKIQNGIDDVKEYLGEKYIKMNLSKFKITYYIEGGKFISHSSGQYIKLSYVKEKKSPYIHETVHVLASYKTKSKWLSEGLAVYLNDHLGGYPSFPNWGEDINKLAKDMLLNDSFKDVLSFDNKFANPSMTTKEKRQAFYIFSGSIVKYIENKYGKEELLRIYDSEDIKEVTGKSFEDIKNEWMNYIKSQ